MIQLVATVFVAIGLAYLVMMKALSRTKRPVAIRGFEPRRFVFVVPALNEERVIAATVENLLALCDDWGRVVVVDDGSTDRTAEILASIDSPKLSVLHRRAPHARLGKGAALNHAYRFIRERAQRTNADPNDVVLCIVDADGRVARNALYRVAPYFRDRRVGAVQLLVRIRNRSGWLCRLQDFEFLVFSSITQTAREKIGSVGLGGNGQFTRLAALMELGDDPWTDCLTEDLDLGVRLATIGWENRFCGESFVDQQGLESVRALVRQHTRWAQGHFQCWRLIPRIVASNMPTTSVLDLCYYLVAPALVLVQSVVFTLGWGWLAYSLIDRPDVLRTRQGIIFATVVYVLSMAPAGYLVQLYRRRSRELSFAQAFVMAHILVAYNYLWYVSEWQAVLRLLRRKGGWAKTARSTEPSVLVASIGGP